uniref:ZP domain-containing protein n=1 Tax=Clytia hemisphaerica TaxID=252671 RepID=A0A7M5UTH4_9CNID
MFLFVSLLAAFAVVHVQSYALLEPKVAEFAVKCNDDSIAVFFNKTALDERQDGNNNNRTWQIYFEGQRGDASCTTYHWDTTKQDANFGLEGEISNPSADLPSNVNIGSAVTRCGINVFADAINIIYNTTVIVMYGENPTAGIGREEYNKYNVMCLRNRTVETDLENFNITYIKTGKASKNDTADFVFSLTHSSIAGPSKPVYKVGEYIKFTLFLTSLRTEVKVVIQRCWTTTDGSANSYDLINGCQTEPGTSWISATEAISTFKTEAFRYLSASENKIFAQCLVRVCLDTQTSAECTLCPPTLKRKRRSIEEEEKTSVRQMALVKSPVFYIIDKDTPAQGSQESSSVLSGTNGLIVIILLATLVFAIAAAIVKKVFFSAPAAVASPVVAYSNKAMA